jgi:hypothetical protein
MSGRNLTRLTGTAGAALLAGIAGSTASAATPGLPACSPQATLGAKLTIRERSLDVRPVATHPVTFDAEVQGGVAFGVAVTAPPGVTVLAGGRGDGGVEIVAPATPTVAMTVTWRQATDPATGDAEDPAASCIGTRVISVPVLRARRSRTVRVAAGGAAYAASFAVLPAAQRPDLSPVEISIAVSPTARIPPASATRRAMTVPLRAEDQLEYPTKLPGLSYATLPTLCRFYYLTCGTVTSHVSALELDDDALRRGIARGDPNGSFRLLARTQPALQSARYGLSVDAFPAKNKIYGFDVQVRQSGRLLGRVRRAGRCATRRTASRLKYRCTVTRQSTLLG